jgi:hypothetical protein
MLRPLVKKRAAYNSGWNNFDKQEDALPHEIKALKKLSK